MKAISIGTPRTVIIDSRIRYLSQIQLQDKNFEMWFDGPRHAMAPQGADAFLIACLPVAMSLGLPLVVEAGISPQLLTATPTIQNIYHKWYPDLEKVTIEAEKRHCESMASCTGSASFFSGGVDSIYTAYKNHDEIDVLVLVHGFDMALNQVNLRSKVSMTLPGVAKIIGKPLIEIETNIRELTDQFVSWPQHQFGPALAAVAVLLGGVASKVFIPASESYAHLDPCGSHPLLDPLWSTEEMEVCHDGAEASRNEKVALISKFPDVLPMLRVCWENPSDSYNCGRCEKCIRTMINLETEGVLNKCSAFSAPLDPKVVASMDIPYELVFHHVAENLRLLRQQNRNPLLIKALEKSVNRYLLKKVKRQFASLPSFECFLALRSFVKAMITRAYMKIRMILKQKKQ